MKLPLDSNKIMSTPEETRENLAIDFGKKINDDIQFYGLITYAHRYGEAYENYRIPTIAPTYYPAGFSPLETIRENDYAATIGLKGDDFFGFDWDLSTTYGADETKIGNKNTANTGMLSSDCSLDSTSANYSSLGCGWTPTNVRAETYRLAQWTNNLDFRRHFNIAQKVPMLLAFGAEHRLETYDLTAGDAASYLLGGTQGYAALARRALEAGAVTSGPATWMETSIRLKTGTWILPGALSTIRTSAMLKTARFPPVMM